MKKFRIKLILPSSTLIIQLLLVASCTTGPLIEKDIEVGQPEPTQKNSEISTNKVKLSVVEDKKLDEQEAIESNAIAHRTLSYTKQEDDTELVLYDTDCKTLGGHYLQGIVAYNNNAERSITNLKKSGRKYLGTHFDLKTKEQFNEEIYYADKIAQSNDDIVLAIRSRSGNIFFFIDKINKKFGYTSYHLNPISGLQIVKECFGYVEVQNSDISNGKQNYINTDTSATTVIMGVDPAIIRKILIDNLPEFRFCYQKELDRNPKEFEGIIPMTFVIGASGRVLKAGIDGDTSLPSNVCECVINILKTIQFPAPKGGGQVETHQPIRFYPKKIY
ncbi:MAG: AgmX/PglI C-terminal domain-containing protein [Oligoflexia bacterium]|nr:AgmX/PglI C-terminal domain-containing protein [Oligoflexia bacterium]